ncbi:MAG: LON peptidase substrate-binding domain-containing protein [Hyphomicrobiales bacterium]
MDLSSIYNSADDLPGRIPVFPLGGALLLPRGQLPLNIFEPRYLAMTNAAISGERIIGMVQPSSDEGLAAEDDADAKPEIYPVGCAGRITSFSETSDGRILITLTGIARFRIEEEMATVTPYRICQVDFDTYTGDLKPGLDQEQVDRDRLLEVFRRYLAAHSLEADWDSVHRSSNETLVNTLSMISPYPPQEKQALLEAEGIVQRAEVLIALTEMALSKTADTPEPRLQ